MGSAETKAVREPWSLASGEWFIKDADGARVVDCTDSGLRAMRRVVACVNAMAGIPDPSAVPEVVEALRDILGMEGPHAPRRTLAEAERLRSRARAALARLSYMERLVRGVRVVLRLNPIGGNVSTWEVVVGGDEITKYASEQEARAAFRRIARHLNAAEDR